MTDANERRSRLFYAILFASLFASLSWLVPAAYYEFSAPQSHVDIESTEVSVVGNQTHELQITYQARARYPVEAEITLYKQTNDTRAKVESWKLARFVEQGRHTASLSLDLSDSLSPGTYVYEISVMIHTKYNVRKTYTYQTDSLTIVAENSTTTPSSSSTRRVPSSEPLPPTR